MSSAGATKTQERVEALLARSTQGSDFPAVAQIIQQLHSAVRKENAGALEVVRLVLKDPGLSSKVLRVVNSAFYRQHADPISTITRAVIVLGFETIRDIATGLIVIEALLRGGGSSEYIRESLKRSLHRGLLAQALSAKIGYPVPEEAYLLGLFADWGMLWTAAYFPDEFERATRVQQETGGRLEDAVREVLGVPPGELAATMLQRWHFPTAYAEFFRLSPAASLAGRSLEDKLLAVVGVAAEATTPKPEDEEDPAGAPLARASARFQTLFNLGTEPFAEAEATARAALHHQAPLYGLGPVETPGEEPDDETAAAADAASDGMRPGGPAHGRSHAHGSGHAGGHGEPPVPDQPGDPQAALAIVTEITKAILDNLDLNDILAMVLEGVARAGGFDVVFLALMSPDRHALVGRLGYGDGVKERLGDLKVPLRPEGGVLAEAVMENRPHVVPNGSPAPELANVRSFVVHPLVLRGKAIGALVAGRTGGGETSPGDLGIVSLFCTQAGLALDRAHR